MDTSFYTTVAQLHHRGVFDLVHTHAHTQSPNYHTYMYIYATMRTKATIVPCSSYTNKKRDAVQLLIENQWCGVR